MLPSFIITFREATVIFLGASSFVSADNNLLGALLGIVVAILVGSLVFFGSMKVNLKIFFNATSILLIFFAAGLVAHGVHELQEAQLIPTAVEHVWDINPPANGDNSYPLLHEKGCIGSLFKGLFGYNGNPSLVEVLSYAAYLALAIMLWKRMNGARKTNPQSAARP